MEDDPVAFFYVQEERYIAVEHMDVRRDYVSVALGPTKEKVRPGTGRDASPLSTDNNTD